MKRWTLPKKIDQLLFKKDQKGVLFALSELAAINSPFLADIDRDYLRYVGHFRVQMLIEWGMYREALAWVCLESELYPDNLENLVLKEQLKTKIYNIPKNPEGIKKPDRPWKDVAGMFELKATIERDLILPLKEKALYERFGVPAPNGFLFYGPPGCGKTFIASAIAYRTDYDFMEIKTSDLASTYVHGTQLEIKRVFDEAYERAPVVLFFDEIEAMVPNRQRSDVSHHYKSEVNEFLAQLEKVERGEIIVIGATNHITDIDPAIIRPGRFDKKIFIGPPDMTARAEGFKIYLKGFPQESIKYELLAEMSTYFTFADIRFVCEEIKRQAIAQKTRITTDYVCKHIVQFRPSLNEDEIDRYFE